MVNVPGTRWRQLSTTARSAAGSLAGGFGDEGLAERVVGPKGVADREDVLGVPGLGRLDVEHGRLGPRLLVDEEDERLPDGVEALDLIRRQSHGWRLPPPAR
jgi:hypothetical protein